MFLEKEIYLLNKIKQIDPWKGDYEYKYNNFKWILKNLCNLYFLPIPKLIIPKNPNKYKWTKKIDGDCWYYQLKIRLKNFSIITLLHEFKHWYDLFDNKKFKPKTNKEKREWEAIYYSITRFYTVWPERIQHLQEIKNKIISENINLSEISFNNFNYSIDPNQQAIYDILLNKTK